MKIYLHIGTHKTGTTSLQHFLFINRDKLLSQGFLYPQSGIPGLNPNGHHRLAWSLKKSKDRDRLVKSWQQLHQEIDRISPENVVISSEDFEIGNPKLVSLVKSHLEKYNTKILIYLRRQDDFLQSVYTQNVKANTCHLKIHKFIQEITEKGRGDYYKLLKPWGDIFGKENIIVRIYEQKKLSNGLYRDFLNCLGIDLEQKYREPEKYLNYSPEPKIVELIRSVNELVWKGEFPFSKQDCYKLYAEPIIKHYNPAPVIEKSKQILSGRERMKIINEFKSSNQKVAREYLGQENLFAAKLPDDNETGFESVGFEYLELREVLSKLEDESQDDRLRQLIYFLDKNYTCLRRQE